MRSPSSARSSSSSRTRCTAVGTESRDGVAGAAGVDKSARPYYQGPAVTGRAGPAEEETHGREYDDEGSAGAEFCNPRMGPRRAAAGHRPAAGRRGGGARRGTGADTHADADTH